MQLVYLLCLLLPLWASLRPSFAMAASPVAPAPVGSAGASPIARLTLVAMAAVVLAVAFSQAYLERHLVFDDAFMSYRYARHLGEGIGLRWNPGETPVEGYTNLLLVVVLAPFVRAGADPLFVTRVISIGCALLLAGIVYQRSRAERSASVALAVSITYLASNEAFRVSMVGLETVWFTALVFLGFHFGSTYLLHDDRRALRRAGVVLFLGLLTRPEAVMLAGLLSLSAVAVGLRSGRWRGDLLAIVSTFWAPLAVYLLFKWLYFGGILPNPAYVKMGSTGLVSESGLTSVRDFLSAQWKLIVVAAATAVLPFDTRAARVRALASAYVLAYVVFYVRVDTLMDIHGRFLFPTAPFLFEIARPLVERAHALWLQPRRDAVWAATAFVVFLFAAIPGHDGILHVVQRARAGDFDYAPGPSHAAGRGHSYHMREKARALGAYPGIEDLTIAAVDAGVLAFDSRARHIDTVGLNDRFIARERDVDRLTAYWFGRAPEIVFQRARLDGSMITYGHGVLGDMSRWAAHPGWDAYEYAGSIVDVEPWRHEMHVYVRRDAENADALRRHLRDKVVDRVHETPPIVLGSARETDAGAR